jgi:hypothetical protein
MPKCPFAVWKPFDGSPGAYVDGHPFKVVHHTTEGPSAEAAFAAYSATRNIPHFTVDDMTIYQHVDTDLAASALRHPTGTTETNRSSAVQIELVGFAGRAKRPASLENLARLCRWIEETHNVPREWPNGHPKPAINGRDPGNHNRNEENWVNKGGHYGHSQVPNNVHWDPAYTELEVNSLMERVEPQNATPPDTETAIMGDHGTTGHHTLSPEASDMEAATGEPTFPRSNESLRAGLRAALRMNEIGDASPYQLSFAGKGKSGASFGFMQGDMAAGQSIAQVAFRAALHAAGVPEAKVAALAQRLSVHLIDNPLTPEDTKLVSDALNAPPGRQQVDAMDENIFENVCKDLDQCISSARGSGRQVTPSAQIYMILWINMTGRPTTLLDWLSGKNVSLKRPIAAPSAVVDAEDMKAYLQATAFFTENPENFPHLMHSTAAGTEIIAVA